MRGDLLPSSQYFNSRPHGGRRMRGDLLPSSQYFNSRPHGGRPVETGRSSTEYIISTHALTEGDKSGQGEGGG